MLTIAVLGASANREKYGNKCVRAYLSKGWKVFPVNPKEEEIEGLKCYKSVLDIDEEIDIASIYLPPSVGIKIVDDLINKKIKKIYLNPETESDEIINKLKKNNIEVLCECSIVAIGISPEEI